MAKLGTPENPEIIEPGQTTARPTAGPAPSALSRVRTGIRLLTFLGLSFVPAFVFDYAWWWLVRAGYQTDNPLPWILALLLTPAAALSTLLTVIAAPLLTLAIIFLALGRPMTPSVRFNVFR